jgi:peptide/nickel transport system substrate-binding protein
MKRILVVLILVMTAAFLASAQTAATVKGPIIDKILFDAKTQEDIGLKDVAAGRSDLWNYGTSGAAFKAIPPDVISKLDVYGVTGVNMVSLLMNPYPNAAPYQVATADGKTLFNPFGIRDVRYAINFLINRKKIIDEIMVGAGLPMYTAVTPGQPNASKYGLIAAKFGFTPTGNETKALADIDAAMNAAAALDANKGRLVKNGQWWTFDGQPVTVKFLIRVDDPTLRLPEGRYIADEIEKAGIKVERDELSRAAARKLWNSSDPKDYQWTLYTEGWGGGQTYAFWEQNINLGAPWGASVPGYGIGGYWQYQNDELDKLTQDATNGRVKDTADYYDKLTKAVELELKDSVRVWIAAQTTYLAGNRDRFNSRMVYGLGDGLDKWSLYTADVKPETTGTDKGLKVLRMTAFSAQGSLFMSSWDPIGPNGFSDTYTSIIIKEASDQEFEANPVTGINIPLRATWSNLKTNIATDDKGNVVGKIPVPASAVLWNAKDQKWESGYTYVDVKGDQSVFDYTKPASITAYSQATFAFKFGKWHDGRAVDVNDYRYALSLPYDVSYKKSADDKVYDEAYAGSVNPNLIRFKGYTFNKDNTITVYGDANYPMDQAALATLLCPSIMIEGLNYGAIVPWEILEAIKAIVSEGNASKTAYSYNTDSSFTEVDVLSQKCVADILAKLQEFVTTERVPTALKGFLTPAQAVADYKLAIAFIQKHGHAYISNGGFILDRYDPANNTGVLLANRDPSYPYAKGYWATALATSFARIDAIKVPTFKKGSDLTVSATVSQVAFPADTSVAAAKGTVKVTIIADKEISYAAKLTKAGTFEAVVPAADLANLKAGSYTVVVEAALGTEAPTVDNSNLIIF